MKKLILQAQPNGTLDILQADFLFYTENLTTTLEVRYPADYENYYKFVDFRMADGTEATYPEDFKDGNTLEVVMGADILKQGFLAIQVFAVGGDGGERIVWQTLKIPVGNSLNVVNFTAYPDPNPLLALINDKMDRNAMNSEVNVLYFDLAPIGGALDAGELRWNQDYGTLELGMNGGEVVQEIGLEQYYRAQNTTGATLKDGKLAMFDGAVGGSGILRARNWDTTSPEFTIMGIFTQDIENGGRGFITWHGMVNNIQTNGANYGETWNDGDILYPSLTIPGGMTKVPNAYQPVCAVVRAHANAGQLYVRCK
jgi:hypothetical protein